MKSSLVVGITIFISIFLSGMVSKKLDFHYSLFESDFNILLFMADLGIYLMFFVPIYLLLMKVIVKEESTQRE